MELAEIYSSLFLTKYGIEDSGAWFESLKDLTPFALDNAIEKLRSMKTGHEFAKYPPNCLQFRALCLSFYDELRLPSVNDAYRETKSRTYSTSPHWSHPVVKYTAKRLTNKFLEIENPKESYAIFKKAYEQVCHLVRQGFPVPEINEPVMLQKSCSKDVALSHLRQMYKHLGV